MPEMRISPEERAAFVRVLKRLVEETEDENWQPRPVMARVGACIVTLEGLLDTAQRRKVLTDQDTTIARMSLKNLKARLWCYLTPYISDFILDSGAGQIHLVPQGLYSGLCLSCGQGFPTDTPLDELLCTECSSVMAHSLTQ